MDFDYTRDILQEDQNRGKANWEHLDEDLHVLIQCEDYENRAVVKLERAKEEIMKLLKPAVNDRYFPLHLIRRFVGRR